MKIDIKLLEGGYWHVRGQGPCNWAQFEHWPVDESSARRVSFPEAGETFIRALVKQALAPAKEDQ
jgi:hypothetical protein